MADLRDAILAKLDDLAADHQPCDPDADCLHRAVAAVVAVLDIHTERADGWCTCGRSRWVCHEIRAIGEALGVSDVR